LIGPRRTEFADRRMFQADSNSGNAILNLVAGTYTLSVDGLDDLTGPYALRLLELSSATNLALGVQQNSLLDPGNETDLYRFHANAGAVSSSMCPVR